MRQVSLRFKVGHGAPCQMVGWSHHDGIESETFVECGSKKLPFAAPNREQAGSHEVRDLPRIRRMN